MYSPINSSNFISQKALRIIRIILGLIIISTVIDRCYYSWNKEIPALMFFTIQSNLLLALFWILSSIFPKLNKHSIAHAISTYIIIVGLVFYILLEDGFLQQIYIKLSQRKIDDYVHYYSMMSSIITHYIMPILAFIDFIVLRDMRKQKMNNKVLIYPLVYFVAALAFGLATGNYVYPFIDGNFLGSWLYLPLIVIGFIIIFKTTHWLLYKLNCFMQNKTDTYFSSILQLNYSKLEMAKE